MAHKGLALGLLAALLFAGCQNDEPVSDDTCGAASYSALIGQDAAAAEDVRAPRRIYTEGDAVTMDFNPDRVNVVLDEGGTIISVECG